MSKKANPTAIGAFVLVGMALLVTAIATLASGQFFSELLIVVSYFDESVQGLDEGSAVKYRGLPIGQVSSVGLSSSSSINDSFLAVEMEIDLDQLKNLGTTANLNEDEVIAALVADGLRSRLETESMVTGIRYISIDVWTDKGPAAFRNPDGPYLEIPSIPSAMAALGQGATDIMTRLSSIDIPAISAEINELLGKLNDRAAELDLSGVSQAIVDMLNAYENLAESEDMQLSQEYLQESLGEVNMLTKTMNEHMGRTLARLDTASVELLSTMQTSRETMEALLASAERSEAMLKPESSFRYSMERSMTEMAEAAKALRLLTEMLERNPRALLTGKSANN